jgi:thymidylate kinase
MNFIIEGLDRLGKSTLIENIQQDLGLYTVVHCGKPKKLKCLDNSLEKYQVEVFLNMFQLLTNSFRLIYDRGHLGELVYAPLYRGYSGEYVFKIEEVFPLSDTRLILLTEDFSRSKHFVDDGLSFDVTKRREEQERFIKAYHMSTLKDKRIVNVTADDGNFRDQMDILREVLCDVQ